MRDGIPAEHKQGWGGTPAVWQALRAGAVDAYPEYTGTIALQILHDPSLRDAAALRSALAPLGIGLTRPLGFANNYALGMRAERAAELGIRTISDLRGTRTCDCGFSSEFMGRSDGWPGLRRAYDLPQTDVAGMDHQLAYRGTVGRRRRRDRSCTRPTPRSARATWPSWPTTATSSRRTRPYSSTDWTWNAGCPTRSPPCGKLEGQLDENAMIGLNERAKSGEDAAAVAASFLASRRPRRRKAARNRRATGSSGRPASTWSWSQFRWPSRSPLRCRWACWPPAGRCFGRVALGFAGVVQTVPSLALLALLIPLLGLLRNVPATGIVPAMIALFLYSLLPILRNTVIGLRGIPPNLREAAEGLGLPPAARLWRVELPLASPSILAGMRTAAVICVGTATLGALIGAGGYGQSITQGVQLNDTTLILEGAIPAALLAMAVDGGFGVLERFLVPKGLAVRTAQLVAVRARQR